MADSSRHTARTNALTNPSIERLLSYTHSRFELTVAAAKRARNINDYYNHLGEGLGKIVPPQVTSVSRKPLSIALEEIAQGKIRIAQNVAGDYFTLADALLDGANIELYVKSSNEPHFRNVLDALNGIAALNGYRFEVSDLHTGSFLARLTPYGDGRHLSPFERKELERVKDVAPMPAHETPAAVEFGRAVHELERSMSPDRFLSGFAFDDSGATLFLKWRDEKGHNCEISRRLSAADAAEFRSSGIELSDLEALQAFIFQGPSGLRKTAE